MQNQKVSFENQHGQALSGLLDLPIEQPIG
jgi:hypothetical protein